MEVYQITLKNALETKLMLTYNSLVGYKIKTYIIDPNYIPLNDHYWFLPTTHSFSVVQIPKSHKCLLRAGECPILSVGGFCHSLSDLMCALGGREPPAEVYKHFVPQVQEGLGQKLELTSVNV